MNHTIQQSTIRAAWAIVLAAALLPSGISHASARTFRELTYQLVSLLDMGTIALVSVAVVVFFIGVVRNLWGYDSGNAEKKRKLQETLFWGIIIIFVMVSIWGIIQILQITLSRGLG